MSSTYTKNNYPAFTVFAFIFALAQLFDHSRSVSTFFHFESEQIGISKILSFLLCVSAVWVMLKPSSVYRSLA